jgi:NAD(P)-dependent dehydrogenase (short-subunit alcohol dehydrogenase family)
MKQADLFDVRGHTAFVTGAASGLGLAFAEVMAMNGARVILSDADSGNLDKVLSRLRGAGCDVEGTVLDVADTRALQAAIDRTAAMDGRLDAIFANVGISSGPGFEVAESGRASARC